VAAPFQKNTLYIMSERERLKAYLEQGYQKPPYFTMVDGIPSFEYPVHDNPHQFKTYSVWMKLLPIDDEKRDVVKVECLVPTCNSHVSVSYTNSSLSISDWMKHAFNNHANVLTKKDRESKSEHREKTKPRNEKRKTPRGFSPSKGKRMLLQSLYAVMVFLFRLQILLAGFSTVTGTA
jgi:hypothetical protein